MSVGQVIADRFDNLCFHNAGHRSEVALIKGPTQNIIQPAWAMTPQSGQGSLGSLKLCLSQLAGMQIRCIGISRHVGEERRYKV